MAIFTILRRVALSAMLCAATGPASAQIMQMPANSAVEPGPPCMPGQVLVGPATCYDVPLSSAVPRGDCPDLSGQPRGAMTGENGAVPFGTTMVPPPCPPPDPDMPRDVRPGVFQKLLFDATWLGRGDSSGFGMEDLQLQTVLGFPFPTRDAPLVVTPGFAAHYLDGPAGLDLPPRVYDAYAEFRILRRLTPRLGMDLAVTPGVFSDFEQTGSRSLRITGHGVAAWTCTSTTKLVLGASYLDRKDIEILPVAGILWNPHPDASFELVFPKPKIAERVYWSGISNDDIQDWIYIAGELGGGTWAIAHTDGTSEVMNYSDYRIYLGVERKVIHQLSSRFEVGYVFGRKISFDGPSPTYWPHETFMLRGALSY